MPTLNPETLGTVPRVIKVETKPSTYSVYIITGSYIECFVSTWQYYLEGSRNLEKEASLEKASDRRYALKADA